MSQSAREQFPVEPMQIQCNRSNVSLNNLFMWVEFYLKVPEFGASDEAIFGPIPEG